MCARLCTLTPPSPLSPVPQVQTEMTCQLCGAEGHGAKTCRMRRVRCQLCDSIGHSAKECDNQGSEMEGEEETDDDVAPREACKVCEAAAGEPCAEDCILRGERGTARGPPPKKATKGKSEPEAPGVAPKLTGADVSRLASDDPKAVAARDDPTSVAEDCVS